MFRALEDNKSLLSLNLANNKLEPPMGAAIRKMLEKNHTLIDLEIGFNNFDLKDVSYTFCLETLCPNTLIQILIFVLDSRNPRCFDPKQKDVRR